MNPETCEGVRDLILRYADALNCFNPTEFGETFALDGVWDVTNRLKAEGRAEVVKHFIALRGEHDWVFQVVYGTRIVSATQETAKARSFIAEYANLKGSPVFLLAVYHDDCVRTDGVWRFAYRKFNALYYGPPDLSAPLRNYPAPDHFQTT